MTKTLTDLMASLAMTNNGYLFAPASWELTVAAQHPEAVDIRRGQIHRRGVQPAHPRQAVAAKPRDTFDYEGAILARQEREMMDY